MLTRAQQSSLLQDLSRAFVSQFYPEELEYFPLVLECLERQSTDSHQADPRSLDLGLPFGNDGALALTTPFVVLTLEATFRELVLHGHVPDLSNVADAVRRAAEALGASRKLVEELGRDLTPRLHRVFQGCELTVTDPNPPDENELAGAPKIRSDQLFVKRMVDGIPRKCGVQSRRVRSENLRNPKYDLIVDEIDRKILVRHDRENNETAEPQESEIDDLDPRAAGLLWLVLEHFGKFIEFHTIQAFLGIDESGRQDDMIHQAKSNLGKVLGADLLKRLFGKSGGKRYSIRRDRFNFCWMLSTDDTRHSELCYRAGNPPE